MVISLKKVLISDEIDEKCVNILKKKGVEVVKNTKLSKEELIAEIPKYDGLIVRSATKVTADVISAASNLKIIGRAGTGVDNIDCNAATQRGIIVMNTPGGNTLSAAEHTCALIVTMSREIPNAAQSMKEGKWDRKKYMGNELNGKTLAIIGLGRIGKEVALRMQSFGMTTIGFDPIIGGDVSSEFDVEWMKLEELWPLADYITVHTPLIPQTKNLINDEVFSKCKKGVKVINCARGGIIDEEGLFRNLETGQCGGAGLDVFVQEPPTDFKLIKHPKVIATPHLGASTYEAQSRVAVEIAEQFLDLSEGLKLFGAINAPALANALSPETQPWVQLAASLGCLSQAISTGSSPKQITLTASGASLQSGGSYLPAAFLSGFLQTSGAGDSKVNFNLINSPVVAKERGIQVNFKTEKSDEELVKVSLESDGQSLVLSGTVSGTSPVLVQIQNSCFSLPPALQGPILLYSADNNTQVLPKLTGELLKAGAQISSFASSTPNGLTWGLVNLALPINSQLEGVKSDLKSLVQLTI
ncbi:hypothetical protein LOTGIDRAFT_200644 [Lottia gigantea]|uniref:D-3-phosphoglycerate dehydrogenase n=1 Tax=Lottia gigantea TaxID=225164 RepID=V4AA63_LOTGI|nr:hypothetical protein LOTGIDRAFT_200644 [Lottia gigantea]ESP00839.1 hypothetical protein LOTGIDRAFT_200644 [Lottia gigantea]